MNDEYELVRIRTVTITEPITLRLNNKNIDISPVKLTVLLTVFEADVKRATLEQGAQ